MSDTLADLASWLPSDFLTGDIDEKRLLPNTHRLPYDFASSSSTESESDDDDVAGLTRRFARSVSFQDPPKIPYPVEKRGFSGSPESTLNWNVYGTTEVRSSPTTPSVQTDEDAWDLIYAAAGNVARMKMNKVKDGVFVNRGLLRAPRPLAPLPQHKPNGTIWSENDVFIRQQQLSQRVASGHNYVGGGRFVAGRALGFGSSAWPPHQVESPRRHQPADGFSVKPVVGGPLGGCGQGISVVKKGCAGTGVFLPRNYCRLPPESKRKQVCSSAHLPARVAQSFNKHLDPTIAQPQANIHGAFTGQHQGPPLPHHHLNRDELAEMIKVYRHNAMMLSQRRSSTHEGVPATRLGQQEVVLPQEWTY